MNSDSSRDSREVGVLRCQPMTDPWRELGEACRNESVVEKPKANEFRMLHGEALC